VSFLKTYWQASVLYFLTCVTIRLYELPRFYNANDESE